MRREVLTRYQLGDGQGLEPLSKEETISLAAFAGGLRLGPSIMISGMPPQPTATATVSRTDNEQTAANSDLNAGRLPSARSMRGLDWLNFLLADVQTGMGPFLAIYLAGYKWNEQRVGIALTIGGIAGIVSQTPAGGLVDRLRSKRSLIAAGVIALAIGALLIAFFPSFWPVVTAQTLIGAMSSIFMPAIAAISIGIVGPELFNRRQGRNQTFNSAGNVAAALMMGLIGYFISNRGVFFFVLALAVPTLVSLLLIRPDEIDYELARGAADGEDDGKPESIRELLKSRPLTIFLCCAVLFHFANAAMLPLLGEMLAKGKGRSSMMFMSACVVTTQFTITLLAAWAGRTAGSWGRKPLLLIGFGVLPIRERPLYPDQQDLLAGRHPGARRYRCWHFWCTFRPGDRRSDSWHRAI